MVSVSYPPVSTVVPYHQTIIGSHFLCLYAHMRKEITFYVFLGEKRDPSKIYANSNLRNLTHITQKPSYVYTFFTYTLKEITALE